MGDRFPLVQPGCDERRKAERCQCELRSLQPESGERKQSPEHESNHKACGKGAKHADMKVSDRQTCGVRAEPKKGRLSQVYLPQVPHCHIEANQQNTVYRQKRKQSQGKRIFHEQRDCREQE